MTCYTHLQCNRGSGSACLDWTEICDGQIQCVDGGHDEEHCWQLEISECGDNEYECAHGQCIPYKFFRDDFRTPECLDESDELHFTADQRGGCIAPDNICASSAACSDLQDPSMCNRIPEGADPFFICTEAEEHFRTDILNFFCQRRTDSQKKAIEHLSLGQPSQPWAHTTRRKKSITLPFRQKTRSSGEHQQRCHRGFYSRVRLDSHRNVSTTTCLCPPSFYSDMCQCQNQRVSLSLQWRTPFAVVVSLIDDSDERIIHSHHQFTYLPILECQMKFNSYLLYSTRPKNRTRRHSPIVEAGCRPLSIHLCPCIVSSCNLSFYAATISPLALTIDASTVNVPNT